MIADPKSERVRQYQGLARIYDQVMSHVNYQGWAQFTSRIFDDHGLPFPNEAYHPALLECGCGTGTLALKLALIGYKVDAFDSSPEMIEVARGKAMNSIACPEFFVQTFENVDFEEKYEGALCLYDSVNYLMTPEAIIDFLGRIRQSLKPKGLFLFDICTEYNSKLHFSGNEVNEETRDFKYHREMIYDSLNSIQENLFIIVFKKEPEHEYVERHQQRIYPVKQVRSMIKKAGLKIVEETDDTQRQKPHSRSLRVHFLCRK